MLSSYQILKNNHFEIYHSIEGEIAQIASHELEKALAFCRQYFSLDDNFPIIRCVFVTNRDEFDRLVRDLLRVKIEIPSNPARIAQTQRFDMVMLSPGAYHEHSPYIYNADSFNRLLFHELVHIIEEYLSPNIEAIPNWWSEGLAIYLSDQWRFDDIFRNPALEGINQNCIPSLSEIESDRRLSYDWGWSIVFYIESLYGQSMLKKIITEFDDGDILKIISNDIRGLELEWKKWLFYKFSV